MLKRFKRICKPVFTFLVMYFTFFAVVSTLCGKFSYSKEMIGGSFLLLNSPSIGYMWIMRVYLMVALITPPLQLFYKRMSRRFMILFLVFLVGLAQYLSTGPSFVVFNPVVHFIFSTYIQYIVAYSTLLILGYLIKGKSFKENISLSLILLSMFVLTLANEDWAFMPKFTAHPPHGVFLTYGLLCSLVLWYAKPILRPLSTNRFVSFFSQNSMWLYLWHIVALLILNVVDEFCSLTVTSYFIPRYVLCLSITVLLFQIWNFVSHFISTRIFSDETA